jgi:hypothetical protein
MIVVSQTFTEQQPFHPQAESESKAGVGDGDADPPAAGDGIGIGTVHRTDFRIPWRFASTTSFRISARAPAVSCLRPVSTVIWRSVGQVRGATAGSTALLYGCCR